MDIIDQRSLSLIPQRVRIVVLVILIVSTLASAGCAIWLIETHAGDALTIALLSIFKACAIGMALWFFLLVGQRAQSRVDLLRRTSEILVSEIPASLQLYGKPDAQAILANPLARQSDATTEQGCAEVIVDIRHTRGTVHAHYGIRWPGIEDTLKLRVHLNVKVMSLVYFFPAEEAGNIEEIFRDTIAAATHSEWLMRVEGRRGQKHLLSDEVLVEMTGRRKLSDDFLHEPTERLFVTNDLAAMTRSIMISWDRRKEPANS